MLKRNDGLKFVKVIYWLHILSEVTYKEDWIPTIKTFFETVLLHPSLCYVRIPKSSIMIDILNDMKKTLITQCKEKKLGPNPLVQLRDGMGYEEEWN